MRYVRLPLLCLLALGAMVVANPNQVSATTNGVPDSIASLGDSITRATNPSLFLFGDQPQYSWSTGDESTVQSHYLRFLAGNASISGKNFNYAVSGAQMADLNGQAVNANATPAGVEYVTILMGANDVCTGSEGSMTAVATFRSQFQTAMNTLATGSPNARIFVASIPDIFNLWDILHTNPTAVLTWGAFSICQSMLVNATSTDPPNVERRDRVRQRNIDFNTQLAEVCALYSQCRFDGNGVFNETFVPGDLSTLDYFHPSIQGQTKLAAGTWAVSDADGDQWTSGAEVIIGSDPLDDCADTSTPNDERGPGFGEPLSPLPPDLNDDQFIDISDIVVVAGSFGQAAPPALARHDVAPDPPDGFVDITDIVKLAGLFGQSCAP